MIVVLNGPIGIGKTTLSDALAESIDCCVMLDGDHLIAANPPADDEREHLHSTIELLVRHHRRFGYRHFVINHVWHSEAALKDLVDRLKLLDGDVRCFLLVAPLEENIQRIKRRAAGMALANLEWEIQVLKEERAALSAAKGLGEPFDMRGATPDLVAALKGRVNSA